MLVFANFKQKVALFLAVIMQGIISHERLNNLFQAKALFLDLVIFSGVTKWNMFMKRVKLFTFYLVLSYG